MSNNLSKISKHLGIQQNVTFKVIDEATGKVVHEHVGHNSATNSLLYGIAQYLIGDAMPDEQHGLNPAYPMLSNYVPRYISLGTMGLMNQNEELGTGLPAGIGDHVVDVDPSDLVYDDQKSYSLYDYYTESQGEGLWNWYQLRPIVDPETGDVVIDPETGLPEEHWVLDVDGEAHYEEACRFTEYLRMCPGYGADGYESSENNGRAYFGLGHAWSSYDVMAHYTEGAEVTYKGTVYTCIADTTDPAGPFDQTKWEAASFQPAYVDRSPIPINIELVSSTFPRSDILYRDVVPEYEAELPKTIDVIFSAMISTGALKQFRPEDKDYIFITEAGLWSKRNWNNTDENGLLAGYRISPPNVKNRNMLNSDNRDLLKHEILKVGVNQCVQVVWKIQLGSIDEFISDDTENTEEESNG